MTDTDRHGPDHDDELLCAYLDEELGADERRALEERLVDDDGLARRLEELSGTVDLVAAVPPASDEEREATLAAVAAAVGDAGPAGGARAVGSPAPLARPFPRTPPAWSKRALWSLAAALLLVVGVAGLLRSGGDDGGGSEAASVAATSIAAATGAGDAAATARIEPSKAQAADGGADPSSGSAEAAPASSTAPVAAPAYTSADEMADLGARPDAASVIDAARGLALLSGPAPPAPTTATPTTASGGFVCPGGTPLARATIDGRPVTVILEPRDASTGGPAGEHLVVRDALTCAELGRAAR